MDANTIVTLIGSLGFPIVACCYMAWFIKQLMQSFREAMDKNTDALQEIKTWIQAIDRRMSDEQP